MLSAECSLESRIRLNQLVCAFGYTHGRRTRAFHFKGNYNLCHPTAKAVGTIIMANYRIQPATPADFPIIQSIARRTWPDTFGDILSPEQITYMLDMMYSIPAMKEQVALGHTFLLLLEKSVESADYPEATTSRYTPVGYVSYQFDYLEATTKIHKLYLLPATQGRGYGKILIQKVEGIALGEGQQKLCLDVNYQNKAVSFYEYLGFEKIGRFNADIGNGYLMEDWQMEKKLIR